MGGNPKKCEWKILISSEISQIFTENSRKRLHPEYWKVKTRVVQLDLFMFEIRLKGIHRIVKESFVRIESVQDIIDREERTSFL